MNEEIQGTKKKKLFSFFLSLINIIKYQLMNHEIVWVKVNSRAYELKTLLNQIAVYFIL